MKKRPSVLVGAIAVFMVSAGSLCALAQASPEPPPTIGPQAVKFVLSHFTIDGEAADPITHQPLQMNGSWSIGKTHPAACPASAQKCAEVFYTAPAQSAKCSWVISLEDNGTDGTVLDENEDAAKYMVRAVSTPEAKPYVKSRSKPAYPPIAMVANVSGVVTLWTLVDTSGKVQKVRVVSGPAMLQQTSTDAAKKWRFVPLTISSRPVSYEVELVFTFQVVRPEWTIVKMAP